MTPLRQAREQIEDALATLQKTAESLGATGVLRGLRAEAARLASARFVIALVGERATGKSTLANALLGGAYLPARPVPTTALVHAARFGEPAGAAVVNADGRAIDVPLADLARFVEGADDSGDRARRVELRVPAELLRSGAVLLDTPGTNDLATLGAEVTYGILPEADVILVVLDATQPLRKTERDFLAHRLPFAARGRTVAVLNRADLLGVTELEEATSYARRQLEKILPGAPLCAVSSKRALDGKDEGFDALRTQVAAMVGHDRQRLTFVRAVGEALRSASGLRDHVRLRREAAKLAEGELEARLHRLQRRAGGASEKASEACARVDARAAEIATEAEGRLADFTAKLREALPREIDAADEADLRKYLPFFLEDTLRLFAEGETERIEEALRALAFEVLSDLGTTDEEETSLELGANAPVKVEVDTMRYDVGVVAAGALGTLFLFSSPLLGVLLLAAAPVLSHVLKGRVAGRVREVAKEQALVAVDGASERLAAKLREEILSAAARLREAVLAHGETAARDAEAALSEVYAAKRSGHGDGDAGLLADAEARIESCARELDGLGRALTEDD